MDFVIETDRLSGGYGKELVLREVSLRVPRASIYGFLGPNGAGKTTALRMVLGLLQPASGAVRLLGEPIPAALPAILRRVGSLIEQPSLYDHLTGAENLEIARRLKFLKRGDVDRVVDWAIDAMGIGDYLQRRTVEYSRGMRQRLGVAIAMLGNPELLLLDEPMNGLDAGGLDRLRRALQNLHREYGTTILLSSHQFEQVEQVATHIGIMSSSGDLLFQGPRERLSERVPQALLIKVDRRDDAVRVLESAGFSVDASKEYLAIHGATSAMASEVNQLLVANRIGVYHLALDSASLEALFVKVTTTVKAWDAL
jgi:lantibiotic transport system ATP-binding protein